VTTKPPTRESGSVGYQLTSNANAMAIAQLVSVSASSSDIGHDCACPGRTSQLKPRRRSRCGCVRVTQPQHVVPMSGSGTRRQQTEGSSLCLSNLGMVAALPYLMAAIRLRVPTVSVATDAGKG
jgi:hypothetical protein